MWNYIYFSIYLDQIDTSDHNAIEGYVYDMVRTLIISLDRKSLTFAFIINPDTGRKPRVLSSASGSIIG